MLNYIESAEMHQFTAGPFTLFAETLGELKEAVEIAFNINILTILN